MPAVTPEVRAVAARMVQLMFEAEGIGLAAPQVGLPWRMFVAHLPESNDPEDPRSASSDPVTATRAPTVYINPVLRDALGSPELYEEGCLSLPDIRGDVFRPPTITIEATDVEGNRFTVRGTGLLARCWQHEVDHLDGVLIIDRMTPMARLRVRSKVRELERRERL